MIITMQSRRMMGMAVAMNARPVTTTTIILAAAPTRCP